MKYIISQLLKTDLQSITSFFKQVYSGNIEYGSKKYFSWKLFNNPASHGIINAALSPKKIVSTTTLTPKSLFIDKREVHAAEIGDTYTMPEHQRKGLFVTLVNKTVNDGITSGIMHIYGTPNKNSLPGYLKKCNFKNIDFLNVNNYTLILDLKCLFPGNTIIQTILIIFNPCYKLFLKILFKIRHKKISFEEIKNFTPSSDAVWQQSLINYDYIFNRHSNYLNWRFNESPYVYRKFSIKSESNIIGYIVIREDLKNRIIYIADYLCEKQHGYFFRKAILILSEKYFITGYNKISAWIDDTDFLLKEFKINLFIKSSKIHVITFSGMNKNIMSGKIKCCHFTLSDSDNI